MPTAVLADDEPLLLDELRSLLADAWPELEIVGRAHSGASARHLLDTLRPDVAFLDIRMPGIDGLTLAGLAPVDTRVVFVTAHPEHALDAFERDAVDYLHKPVTPARLARTVQRLATRLAARPARPAATGDARFLQAWVGHTLRLVEVDQVAALCSELRHTRVTALDGTTLLLRRSLQDLLQELDPALFWQIHRGSVINARAITRVERRDDGEWLVHLRHQAAPLPVSRAHRGRFRGM